jgi:hypothetical protein
MFLPMHLSHFAHCFVHKILSRYVKRIRKVIHLLVFRESLVDLGFQGRAAPEYREVLALCSWYLPKSIVFKCIADNLHITFMKFKIVAPVSRWVRSYCYRVFIWSEYKELFF